MSELIYISAEWCQPCKSFSPIISKVQGVGIPVTKLDADRDKQELVKYGVKTVPTLLKMNSSGTIVGKLTGLKTFQEVVNFYNQ